MASRQAGGGQPGRVLGVSPCAEPRRLEELLSSTPQNHLYNISRSSFRLLLMLQRKRGKRLEALA